MLNLLFKKIGGKIANIQYIVDFSGFYFLFIF